MFRTALFPILLLLASSLFIDTCKGQTFQYSRGWTNGKRSQDRLIDNQNRLQQRERNLSENIEQFLLERCMLETWNELKKTSLFTPTSVVKLPTSSRSSNSNSNLDNNNNNLFGSHHQSNDEQFD